MTHKTQKIISTSLVAVAVIGGFEALLYLLNLNQPAIFLQVAFWIFMYLVFNVIFLFDLHFKKRGSWQRARLRGGSTGAFFRQDIKVAWAAFLDRVAHLRRWDYFRQWLHFLLLPGFIFWATASLLYVNYMIMLSSSRYAFTQQFLIVFSGIALIVDYWYVKEVFYRRKEVMDSDIFVVLTLIKIFTALLLYAASLSMLRYYCLPPVYFAAEVFAYTFLLIYHALYQHRLVSGFTMAITLLIGLLMGLIGYLVYVHWAINYFTAAVFLTACYNLFWGIFHYRLDRALTRQTFFEVFLVSVLIGAMMFSTTNFRAKILNDCDYSTGQTR